MRSEWFSDQEALREMRPVFLVLALDESLFKWALKSIPDTENIMADTM